MGLGFRVLGFGFMLSHSMVHAFGVLKASCSGLKV